jgi:hypothetical protein
VQLFLVAVASWRSPGDHPSLDMLALYAATGGADFVIQAGLLARRRRRPAGMPA